MRSIIARGHQESAICPRCSPIVKSTVVVTYRYAPMQCDDGTEIDNVLQGFCDRCGDAVLIASQSSYRTARALQDRRLKRTRIRLPLELTDYMATQLSMAGIVSDDFDEYFRALFQSVSGRESYWAKRLAAIEHPTLTLPLTESEHLTLSPKMSDLLNRIQAVTTLNSASEVVRRMIALADVDDDFSDLVGSHLKASALVQS